MALILSIDTATEACSAAINNNGEVQEIFEVIPRQHSKRLLPMIDQLLAEQGVSRSQIDAVAFGRGPGAFTGVRIATGIAQGLGWALNCPVVPVSTLAALAQQGLREYGAEQVLAAIDARMDEVYWGIYSASNGIMEAVRDEQVCAPELTRESIPEGWLESALGIGTGWGYSERMGFSPARTVIGAFPHAGDIATLAAPMLEQGQGVDADKALPVYLRDNVALKKSER
ncbi:tRNA (adenosine(37)-N6)-threonylcarbamoyltransferase complex dimerization subunit type 1 TsaB [Sansalvadorimonas sp. 2012CJ34-2]|uniref:tRNA threonylcarbamoyladenosine biosynthesis protein TsaB n=1 Tax=Parendozoicomonas callyspongiae TaxID=2942213 RepID=A0ABT0PHW4_9GAMM|nr:tRNA (adenosine(37)-N6)-threonylcarbamoyltransferase complex dimerization subunit type 1 TsaB [Sansalvadorimonas sp. 2012CJ34-2]MCL6270944.1 tRNA (adenosine(37)-N6)-threonylcarbamoyltransferase complex dimerization subunit type 1 TsaB [Sansalvadorimonas sp. 2012CJ34-2]